LTLQIPESENLIDAIAFNTAPELLENELDTITLVYRLEINEFRGNYNPQLLVDQVVDFSLA